MRSPARETRGTRVLGSLIEDHPTAWRELAAGVRRAIGALADAERAELGESIYTDLFPEYDARFLSEHVRRLDRGLSPSFFEVERSWAVDEGLHYRGFRVIYAALSGRSEEDVDAEMAGRRGDVRFEPLADLFEDELSICLLLAYDELATVRAYRACRPTYERLGRETVEFVGRVTADEGRHYRNFQQLVRERHAHRLGEVPAFLERIRAHEGILYGNTFVLDHDDAVWSEEIFDASADALRRHLRAGGRGS